MCITNELARYRTFETVLSVHRPFRGGLVITSYGPTRVLLWSPNGSSEKYHGPGSFAYRLYSLADPAVTRVGLVHGSRHQPRLELFRHQHYIKGGASFFGTLAYLHRAQRWLAEYVKYYDVFHGLGAYHRTVKPAYQAHRLGMPAVLFITGHRGELVDKPGIRGLLGWPRKRREMIRELDGLIAMSSAIYDELIECGVKPRNIARIPMGVNTDRFQPSTNSKEKTELRRALELRDRTTLLFVGAIIRRKQPHLLVQAIGRLIAQGLDCQLVLVGPSHQPDYDRQIREFIRQERLEEHITIVGFTERVELYHRAADIFALPARSEGMPAAMVEAMSSGLACMGTPISGISDLIEDGYNGRIVQGSVDSVVEALTGYLRDPILIKEHGNRSRDLALRGYSGLSVLRAHQDLFRCVIEGRDACDASVQPKAVPTAAPVQFDYVDGYGLFEDSVG